MKWLRHRRAGRRDTAGDDALQTGGEGHKVKLLRGFRVSARAVEVLARPQSRIWLRLATFLLLSAGVYGLWQRTVPDSLRTPTPPAVELGLTEQGGSANPDLPQGQVADLSARLDGGSFAYASPILESPVPGREDITGAFANEPADAVETALVQPRLPAILDLSQAVWPVTGSVRGEYGWYRDAATNDWRFRPGVLIQPEREEAPVRASLSGIVEEVTTAGNGYRVVLAHAEGWSSEYAGLQTVDVVPGQHIEVGDRIGSISLAPHRPGLYFTVRNDSGPVNPQDLLYTPPVR